MATPERARTTAGDADTPDPKGANDKHTPEKPEKPPVPPCQYWFGQGPEDPEGWICERQGAYRALTERAEGWYVFCERCMGVMVQAGVVVRFERLR